LSILHRVAVFTSRAQVRSSLQNPVTNELILLSDPTKQPAIDPAYLKHPADVAVLAAGMKFLDKLAESGHLKDKLGKRLNPSPELDLKDMEVAKEAVREWVMGEYHPCGTCSMGQVVDGKLKVNGVSGLRVADASIFPNHVSGNICSSVYAVAEKAADIIKADYA
jgi:choline dehydrogenase-like flavoprotein